MDVGTARPDRPASGAIGAFTRPEVSTRWLGAAHVTHDDRRSPTPQAAWRRFRRCRCLSFLDRSEQQIAWISRPLGAGAGQKGRYTSPGYLIDWPLGVPTGVRNSPVRDPPRSFAHDSHRDHVLRGGHCFGTERRRRAAILSVTVGPTTQDEVGLARVAGERDQHRGASRRNRGARQARRGPLSIRATHRQTPLENHNEYCGCS